MRIHDPRLARIFADARKRRILLLCVEEARTVSQIAEMLQLPMSQAHYHTTALQEQGLLKISREESRAGRAIKHYRAASSSFLVPVEHFTTSPGSGLAAELRESLDKELLCSTEDGVLFYVENGDPRVSWFAADQRSCATAGEYWQILSLDAKTARAFAADVQSLMQKYKSVSGNGQRYLLHAAFGPGRR